MSKMRVYFDNGIKAVNKISNFIFQLLNYFNIFILKISLGEVYEVPFVIFQSENSCGIYAIGTGHDSQPR